jgi:hypothetical protein
MSESVRKPDTSYIDSGRKHREEPQPAASATGDDYGRQERMIRSSSTASPLRQSEFENTRSYSPSRKEENLEIIIREFLKPLMEIERRIEEQRTSLSLRSDMSLAGVFNMFSGYTQARVTNTDFMFGLERLGV